MLLSFMLITLNFHFRWALEDEKPKRLLLSDPDVIQTQLTSLEHKLKVMESKVTVLETKNSNLEAENLKLKNDVGAIRQESSTSKGVVYMRWGRKDCPPVNGTALVYSGFAGGGSYSHNGDGTNNLCLPHDPDLSDLSKPISTHYNNYAYVYGAEYQFSFSDVQVDDDVPCAACLDSKATTVLTIPGKSVCPMGWRKQYDGLLCSNHYRYAGAFEYSCIDGNPQFFDGRRANEDGKLFYPVLTSCGSLPCPPYENNKKMRCAVCTK